jgi:hypothetical protein
LGHDVPIGSGGDKKVYAPMNLVARLPDLISSYKDRSQASMLRVVGSDGHNIDPQCSEEASATSCELVTAYGRLRQRVPRLLSRLRINL